MSRRNDRDMEWNRERYLSDWNRERPSSTYNDWSPATEYVRRFVGKGPKGYKRTDERIREDVHDRLSEGWIDATEIEVDVKSGEVTLKGTVTDRSSKVMAEDLVEHVTGVVDVHNQLRVANPAKAEKR